MKKTNNSIKTNPNKRQLQRMKMKMLIWLKKAS